MTRPRFVIPGIALAFAIGLALAGCSTKPAAICPRVAILDQASTVTGFRPGGTVVPDDVTYRASMNSIDTDCRYSGTGNTTLEANVHLHITAERGPALQGNTANAQYFIVITNRGGTVLAKRVFPLKIDFGTQHAVNLTEGTWQQFILERGGGAGYEIWAGWQLTDAQLQFNRQTQQQ